MALLLTSTPGSAEAWRYALVAAMPDLDVRVWPNVGNRADIDIAAVGAPPAGALRDLPNLRLIISLTAGIDALLRDPDLSDVPISRSGDPAGDAMINKTTLLHVLRHHRYMPEYQAAQQRREWIKPPIKAAHERRVGVMGLGPIGMAAAKMLFAAGFQVAGRVRNPRPGDGVEIFSGGGPWPPSLSAARSW